MQLFSSTQIHENQVTRCLPLIDIVNMNDASMQDVLFSLCVHCIYFLYKISFVPLSFLQTELLFFSPRTAWSYMCMSVSGVRQHVRGNNVSYIDCHVFILSLTQYDSSILFLFEVTFRIFG